MDPLRFAVQRLRLHWQTLLGAAMVAAAAPASRRRKPADPAATLPAEASRSRQPLPLAAGGSALPLVAPRPQNALPADRRAEESVRPTVLPGSELPGLLLEAISCLRAAQLPLDRLSLALVPEQSGFHGSQHQWSVDEPERVRSFLRLYEFFQGPDHRTSVLHHVCCTGQHQRLRLQQLPPEAIPFPLLRELRRDHFHDYLALPLPPGGSHRVVLTLATRQRQGFSSAQLALLRCLLPSLRRLLRGTDHFGLGRWESLDPLTAVGSRHRLLQELASALAGGVNPPAAAGAGGPSADAAQASFSLLLLDLEDFGAYNRVFGSFAADDALVAVARQLHSHWGPQAQTIARIGSDSFALLLRGLNPEALAALATAVQDSITALRLVHPPAQDPFLGASLAALSWSAGSSGAGSGPLERARALLLEAEALLEQARRDPGPSIRLGLWPQGHGAQP